MPSGWTGKILRLDLSTRKVGYINPTSDVYRSFVGGKGLAGYYLSDHITKSFDHPEMPILLFTGPLVGTASPTSGRMTIMSRSPLTGTVGDASVGGNLGTGLKRAGLDGVLITGQSSAWVGVEIRDDAVTFTDARQMCGEPIPKSAERLADSGAHLIIGPAAENGVRFASVMIDKHFTAGRSGLGLSFAAKRLKYLAVKGTGKVAVHDENGLKKARDDIRRLIAASPVLLGEHGISNLGTAALYDLMHARRMMPTNNFAGTFFPPAPELGAHRLKKRYHPKKAGCRGCHILCKKRTKEGEHLPEFETLSHFTALLENDDLDLACAANTLCNDLGMDTISAAATLSCHRELSGEKMRPDKLLSTLQDIAFGRGIGAELKMGSLYYATRHGRRELSMSVKGQELPAYDPRGAYGMALAYATSTRGGCHLRAYPISHEILRKPVVTDRFSFSGKARIIKIAEDANAIIDSLTACKFVFFACSLEEYACAFQAVTGVATTANDLSRIGERIYYHERMMNSLNGFDADDDDLPPRFFGEPGTDGPSFKTPVIDRTEFLKCREKYYKIRGLSRSGKPTREKAEELGLKWNNS